MAGEASSGGLGTGVCREWSMRSKCCLTRHYIVVELHDAVTSACSGRKAAGTNGPRLDAGIVLAPLPGTTITTHRIGI